MTRLEALLETVLPGDGAFPSAGALGLAAQVPDIPRFAEAAARIGAAAEGIETLAPEARAARLAEIEAADPEGFGAFLVAAYSLYYTHPEALASVERETGYKAAPPQPGGYALAPFDPALLEGPRARGKRWREA